jgi:hypothetical protein
MRRRRLEFFEESLLGLLGVYRLAVDTGSRVQEVFDRMAQVIIAVHGVSESEEVSFEWYISMHGGWFIFCKFIGTVWFVPFVLIFLSTQNRCFLYFFPKYR